MNQEIKGNWIFCCGGKRSGSTLQYNLVSSIVEKYGVGRRVEYHKPEEFDIVKKKYENDLDYKVFKTHRLTTLIKDEIKTNNALAFYSYRDIRDVVVSFIKKGWLENDKKAIGDACKEYLNDYYVWMSIETSLIIRKYEDFYDKIEKEIVFIIKSLGLAVNDSIVREIMEENLIENVKLKLPKENSILGNSKEPVFDQKTLMHVNHINDGSHNQFQKTLTVNEIVNIEKVASHWLKSMGYRLQWPETNYFVSYSQHKDDFIAWYLLGEKRNGKFVEVGAFDGVHLSNTESLESIGWSGICIEPNPRYFSYLKKNRDKSINYNCAVVGDEEIKSIPFFAEEIGVLSGCVYDEEDVKRRYENRGLEYHEPSKIEVEASTLNRIFKENNFKKGEVDLISIDVEGFEIEVLKGLDLDKFEPKLLIIEANDSKFEEIIFKYMSNFSDYKAILKNRQNLYFAHKTVKHIKIMNLDKCISAYQFHPFGETFSIQSISEDIKYFKRRNFIQKLFNRS